MTVSKNNESVVLLLTGTIKPNSFNTLVLKDPEIRKSQYIDAIKFYLGSTEYKIIFAENSGQSLKEYFRNHEDRVEFLTFESPQQIPDRGKGYKELEIVNFAVNNSKFLLNAKFIVKITGRLQVLNINKLMLRFLKTKKTPIELVGCNLYKNNRMDSRCFLFTVDFLPFLNKNGKNINLKYSFESALFDSVLDYWVLDAGNYKQFSLPLRIKGVSGGFGTAYDHSFFTTIIKQIRHLFKMPFNYRILQRHKQK